MSAFLVWLGNHTPTGQRSLEDVVGIFGHQLRALGHECIWDPKNDQFLTQDMGYNIIVEGFTDASISLIGRAHQQGARFICIATEEPTPKGFNHGRDREMVSRQVKFPMAAQFFDAIFHLVPGGHITDWFSQYAPSAYVELGYARTLYRPSLQEPAYNFGFFGSLTPRRLKILKRLARAVGTEKAVRIEATFATQEERDRIMREARVIVQLRKHEEMGLVSSSRCNTALHLGRPVVAEPHLLADQWNSIVKFSQHCNACASGQTVKHSRNEVCDRCVENFINDCLLAQAMWKGLHGTQFTRFSERMTPEYCVGRALREVGLRLTVNSPLKVVAA
jgi:hypothetical protein